MIFCFKNIISSKAFSGISHTWQVGRGGGYFGAVVNVWGGSKKLEVCVCVRTFINFTSLS